MTGLPVLTLDPVTACLAAEGVVTAIPRKQAAPAWVVGQRVGIHASRSLAVIDNLPGDCEGKSEAGWVYGYVGPYQVGYCCRTSDEGTRGDTFIVKADGSEPGVDFDVDARLALGCIVASATLRACVPIVEGTDELAAAEPRPCVVWSNSTELTAYFDPSWDGMELDDQLPYGDWSPGRWAWLLEGVAHVRDRCPWCWDTGGVCPECNEDWCGLCGNEPGEPRCRACAGAARCAPVPFRGGPGLRRWTP